MRALTICQPYATLIMAGDKRVENRTWPTKYRGRLYVHAGKSRDWMSTKQLDGVEFCMHTQRPVSELPFGAVIGVATLIECLPIEEIRAGDWDEKYPWLRGHQHTEGPWCWLFAESPASIGPWPFKGSQGLFDINPLTLDTIANRTIAARAAT